MWSVDACGQGEVGVKNTIFCGRHKWMAPNYSNSDVTLRLNPVDGYYLVDP